MVFEDFKAKLSVVLKPLFLKLNLGFVGISLSDLDRCFNFFVFAVHKFKNASFRVDLGQTSPLIAVK